MADKDFDGVMSGKPDVARKGQSLKGTTMNTVQDNVRPTCLCSCGRNGEVEREFFAGIPHYLNYLGRIKEGALFSVTVGRFVQGHIKKKL